MFTFDSFVNPKRDFIVSKLTFYNRDFHKQFSIKKSRVFDRRVDICKVEASNERIN